MFGRQPPYAATVLAFHCLNVPVKFSIIAIYMFTIHIVAWISLNLWKGNSVVLVLSIKSSLEEASGAMIDLCVLRLPANIEQTERPAESCLSSSPVSLLSLTASKAKHLSRDKSNIARGEARSLGCTNFVTAEMKVSWNWKSVAAGQLNWICGPVGWYAQELFTSALNECTCYSSAFDHVY